MAVASAPFAMGALYLKTCWLWRMAIFLVTALVCAYFSHEGRCSSKTLSEVRRELLKKNWDSQHTPELTP
jgi:hypothetical protein